MTAPAPSRLSLFNTLTRRVEPLVPLAPPRVTLYTCGPTVWNYAHIGNFRTFLFEDLLRRWVGQSGYDVFHIMNLTDVDDRTIKAARQAGKQLTDHTAPFTKAFFEDRDYLRIKPAHVYTPATEYMPQMIALVSKLIERGVAYKGEDGSVYFAINKFPTYGRLSQLDKREIKVGARVASDEYAKGDPSDFALWKKADAEAEAVGAVWDAPFGRGRPGWHLECSAMSLDEFHARLTENGKRETGNRPLGESSRQLENDIAAALNDDLNAPRAVAALFDFVRAANRELDRPQRTGGAAAALGAFERVTGALFDILPTEPAADPALERWVAERIAARAQARKSKDFKAADALRAELQARGVEIEDTPTGTKWRVG